MIDEKPLVTFALITYNQEKYIVDALNSVFLQDYPNLEVIISDDGSSDNSWKIIQDKVADYRGIHSIKINRNIVNLGVGGHINLVNKLAAGRIVVVGAGDDISLPNRVSRIVDGWRRHGGHAALFHSACMLMDNLSIPIRYFSFKKNPSFMAAPDILKKNASVIGATEAWDKVLFEVFGDLNESLVHEDHALTFRAALLQKKIAFLDEPLVRYRQHTGVSSSYGSWYITPSDRKKMLANYIVEATQKLADLAVVSSATLENLAWESLRRYEVALSFESGFPTSLSQWVRMSRATNHAYLIRMVIKRMRNGVLDFLLTGRGEVSDGSR